MASTWIAIRLTLTLWDLPRAEKSWPVARPLCTRRPRNGRNVSPACDKRKPSGIWRSGSGAMMDITDRKLAEARIVDWKNRYEAAILASKLIIYEWNPDTNTMMFGGNVENILGFQPEE